MLHDVISSVPFFQFFPQKSNKHKKTYYFPYFSPQKGTLTLTPGMGWGGPFRTPKNLQKSPKNSKNILRTKIVHTSGTFFQKISENLKNIFQICSDIQKNTTNTINTFRISIYNIKFTKIPKDSRTFPKFSTKK